MSTSQPIEGRLVRGKPVKRWGGKPLPLPTLGPDGPTDDVAGDWGKSPAHEEMMRQSYNSARRAAAVAVTRFLNGRRVQDLKTEADLATFRQLNGRFDELAQAEHLRRTRG